MLSFYTLSHLVGVLGGKFLERGRVKKPGQELFKSQLSQYFTAQDLYVGATLCLNSINFQLLDADEYTFKYMEQHAEEVRRKNNKSAQAGFSFLSQGHEAVRFSLSAIKHVFCVTL